MRTEFLENLGELAAPVLPRFRPECVDPECKHRTCIENPDTGKYYKNRLVFCRPEEDELTAVLLAAQLKELRTIKAVLILFAVLAAVAVVVPLLTPALIR